MPERSELPFPLTDLRRQAADTPGLRLLILHGSRARGDARADSDWDFAWLGDDAVDPDRLMAMLAEATKADRVDLADLRRAGALLRYRVARDGVVVFEREPSVFLDFWLEAVHTWCDLAPVLTLAYEDVLAAVPRR
jgi:predicted nucleotidyltransferase